MSTITVDGHLLDVDDDVVAAIAELGLDIAEDVDDGVSPPDERAQYLSNSYGVYRWGLADGRSLFIDLVEGGVTYAGVDEGDIADHLLNWDHYSVPETAEWMAGWGYLGLGYEQVADEGYDGPCRVWREPDCYEGTYTAPNPGYARDDKDEILEFASREEAEAYVDEYYDAPSQYDGVAACRVLSHGQAGPDQLTIVKA